MNSKQRRTLEAIFSTPTPRNLTWDECVSLLKAVGCEVVTGAGSQVTFVHGKRSFHMHKPHPQKECLPYKILAIRVFLEKLEIMP